MRIKGQKVEGLNREIIAIPRGEGKQDIILIAEAIVDYNEFNALCPLPKPPNKIQRGVGPVPDLKNKIYLSQIENYSKQKTNYMLIRSLMATPDFEWESCKLEDPVTWNNVENELSNSGFSEFEVQKIISGVMIANGLNEARVEEARERFLLGKEEVFAPSTSLSTDPNSMPNGEHVKESVLDHPVSVKPGTK
jgi:hypothetical protein